MVKRTRYAIAGYNSADMHQIMTLLDNYNRDEKTLSDNPIRNIINIAHKPNLIHCDVLSVLESDFLDFLQPVENRNIASVNVVMKFRSNG
jgi:hypothetical protein